VENIDLHLKPQEFQAALYYTAAETGFSPRLIEKDYWCSLILRELFIDKTTELVFKGGTLLSKAFTGFDRLSEDLDFTISTHSETRRTKRSFRAELIESKLSDIAIRLDLKWSEIWCGHNNSSQYRGRLSYPAIIGLRENILIEVSQREPLLEQPIATPLNTLILNPLFREPAIKSVLAMTLSIREAYAEKARAALTREDPAIRDLYDLLQGYRNNFILIDDTHWIDMVYQKCSGLDLTKACSKFRYYKFILEIETNLLPVLRNGAASQFDINQAWRIVKDIYIKLIKRSDL
jgi:predicted nucleotidyltransferase component of viral defense system